MKWSSLIIGVVCLKSKVVCLDMHCPLFGDSHTTQARPHPQHQQLHLQLQLHTTVCSFRQRTCLVGEDVFKLEMSQYD